MSNPKNTQIYYPHNANARNEDNMIRLRMAHGVAGYGVYHMLLERLRLSEGYKCDLDYEILSFDLDCSEDLIRSVIYDFGLFEIVDDGQRFCSVELNAYMQIMEEKKEERKKRAQEAAAARWEKEGSASQKEGKQELNVVPLESPDSEEAATVDETKRLDKEMEAIKGDGTWLVEMANESGKSKDDILSYIPDFRQSCLLKGLKGGHKDMADTLTHFRSWIYKSGRAKDPNARHGDNTSVGQRGRKRDESLRQTVERTARWKEYERNKTAPDDYIRSKGYDPKDVTMVQLMQPGWIDNNPPTHPEWITPSPSPASVDIPF